MACLNHVFSLQELEKLDEKQLAILDDAILREIQTSKKIRNILRGTLRARLLKRWQAKGLGRRARRGKRAMAKR